MLTIIVVDASNTTQAVDKRALLLSFIVMGAAGHLVEQLDRGLDGNSSQRVLRDTNLDVITAEGENLIHFLMIRLCDTDQKKSPEMFGRVDDSTFIEAFKFVLQTIAQQTGFDFKEAAIQRGRLPAQIGKNEQSASAENPKLHLLHCGVLRRLTPLRAIIRHSAYHVLRNSSGSLAMFAAMPRFIFGEQLGRRSPSRLILKIDIGEHLAVVVTHRECGSAFLDSPRRREASGRQRDHAPL